MERLITNERPLPAAIAPSLGLSPWICLRCFSGEDNDGDGNCGVCAKLDYAGALELRLLSIARRLRQNRLGQVEALLGFCERTLR